MCRTNLQIKCLRLFKDDGAAVPEDIVLDEERVSRRFENKVLHEGLGYVIISLQRKKKEIILRKTVPEEAESHL